MAGLQLKLGTFHASGPVHLPTSDSGADSALSSPAAPRARARCSGLEAGVHSMLSAWLVCDGLRNTVAPCGPEAGVCESNAGDVEQPEAERAGSGCQDCDVENVAAAGVASGCKVWTEDWPADRNRGPSKPEAADGGQPLLLNTAAMRERSARTSALSQELRNGESGCYL